MDLRQLDHFMQVPELGSVMLTEPGRRRLAHAQANLQTVERSRRDLDGQHGAAAERRAIALQPSLSRTLTGPLVAAFVERPPTAAAPAWRW
jgi:LysR family transcriptional regulator, nitrogen assimilation regulatory protein